MLARSSYVHSLPHGNDRYMRIILDKDIIHSPSHLFYDDLTNEYGWSNEFSKDSYVITDKLGIIYDINEVRKLLGLSEIYPRFEVFQKAYCKLTAGPVPWFHVIPRKMFLNHMREVFSKALNQISLENDSRYIGIFLSEREMLCELNTSCVDNVKIQGYIDNEPNPTVKKSLQTFIGDDGWSPSIFYSQTTTLTGRLVVKKGPQILTLPKKYRDVLTSRYDGGQVMEIDFTSLEPTVLANLQGVEIGGDIYEELSRKVFDGEISRGITKVVMLSALYGASKNTLQGLIPKKYSAHDLVSKIHNFFNTRSLVHELSTEIKNTGYMHNFFGRRIKKTEEYRVISHYLQSTAVDVALLGFKEISRKIVGDGILPLYIIHDAMVLDVPKEGIEKLQAIVNKGIEIPQLGKFSLKLKPFHCSQ